MYCTINHLFKLFQAVVRHDFFQNLISLPELHCFSPPLHMQQGCKVVFITWIRYKKGEIHSLEMIATASGTLSQPPLLYCQEKSTLTGTEVNNYNKVLWVINIAFHLTCILQFISELCWMPEYITVIEGIIVPIIIPRFHCTSNSSLYVFLNNTYCKSFTMDLVYFIVLSITLK